MYYIKEIEAFALSFQEICDRSGSIIIATMKSDEDGIASVLALYFLLKNTYPEKNIKPVVCSYFNKRWSHLHGFNDIEFVESLQPYLDKFDCAIFLDHNQYEHFGLEKHSAEKSMTTKVCIDHHATRADKFDLLLEIQAATSTSELIYHTFVAGLPRVHPYLAELLLVGILGDTGGMKYANQATIHMFSVIQRLVTEQKVDIPSLLAQWKKYSEREFRAIQEFVKNTRVVKVAGWRPCVVSYVNKGFREHGTYTNLELGEAASYYASNFGTLISESGWGIVFYPQKSGKIRFKIRSEPGIVNVERVARAFDEISGGGHECAAGGYLDASVMSDLSRAGEFMTDWLRNHSYDRVLTELRNIRQDLPTVNG